ncbi:MAG: ribonuclease P protein component [Clostridia bacterium]|nr:ribonuclease P protein component [Clostridia bacterium]
MDNRLKKQKDFDLVFSKGKRIYTNSLTLIYLKNNTFKFGISLSKKHGKAVVRNRIKRLLRSIIRQSLKIIKENYYIIVLPKISDNYIYDNLERDYLYALKKGSIIND